MFTLSVVGRQEEIREEGCVRAVGERTAAAAATVALDCPECQGSTVKKVKMTTKKIPGV